MGQKTYTLHVTGKYRLIIQTPEGDLEYVTEDLAGDLSAHDNCPFVGLGAKVSMIMRRLQKAEKPEPAPDAQSGWVAVEQALPEPAQYVDWWSKVSGGRVCDGVLIGESILLRHPIHDSIQVPLASMTHWRPAPPPPKSVPFIDWVAAAEALGHEFSCTCCHGATCPTHDEHKRVCRKCGLRDEALRQPCTAKPQSTQA